MHDPVLLLYSVRQVGWVLCLCAQVPGYLNPEVTFGTSPIDSFSHVQQENKALVRLLLNAICGHVIVCTVLLLP
jgi:hypothetical protein